LAGAVAVCAVFLVLLWLMLRLRSRRNTALTERNDALSERNTALSERNTALDELTVALSERNTALTERNDALSDMNTTKDRFFNIISHDLKNPALALNDALRILVKKGLLWDADTLTGYYGDLLLSSENHVELILHLLNWAKAQTGRITCSPKKFYLADRLHPDVAQVRGMAQKKAVALVDAVPEDTVVDADPDIIATVVRNLLTNAVKFTRADGTVTLSATPSADGRLTVTVSDTGVGMSEEQIQNLFRLDSARSKPGTAGEQGTGLGLIVCRDLLEKHGATLHVESCQGEGSRFSFELRTF